jgi:hypothetical protein
VGNHAHRHEVLVAQRMAAMVVCVDQVEKWMSGIFVFDLLAPVDCLLGDERRIDQDNAFFCIDKAGRATTVMIVNKNTRNEFFAFAQPGDANTNSASTSSHLDNFPYFSNDVLRIYQRKQIAIRNGIIFFL